jgi:hypothetical protein
VGQFGAAIDSLEAAIDASRRTLGRPLAFSEYWYVVYHTLFFLDYYRPKRRGVCAPAPFTLTELDPAGCSRIAY